MRNPDESEFTAFVERNSRFVFRVAYAMLRNACDAEDVAQETFLKLWRKNAWHGLENEHAFLARAAWRMASDRIDSARARFSHPSQRAEDSDLPSPAPDPEQLAISTLWTAAIHRLIDSLPEELRQPLALSSIEDLNSREIAAVLSVPEGTVRTRVMRARRLLREKLTAVDPPAEREMPHAARCR